MNQLPTPSIPKMIQNRFLNHVRYKVRIPVKIQPAYTPPADLRVNGPLSKLGLLGKIEDFVTEF